jgi:hypothetical protein
MKKWQAGYLVSSGYKVEYLENGEEKSMMFPTEDEAVEYFKEEEKDRG